MEKITENFTLEQLAVCNRYPQLAEENLQHARENYGILTKLCSIILEPIRLIIGPFIISSGIRCPALNKIVGGSPTSQHPLGQAVDIIPRRMSVKKAFEMLSKSNIPFGQLIYEKHGDVEWIHISLGAPWRALAKCGQILKIVKN